MCTPDAQAEDTADFVCVCVCARIYKVCISNMIVIDHPPIFWHTFQSDSYIK